jgi:hypothetical protein
MQNGLDHQLKIGHIKKIRALFARRKGLDGGMMSIY